MQDLSLGIAEKQAGVLEVGRNSGEEVEGYLHSVGLGKGHPYCLAGQYWTFQEASKILNQKNPLKKTGHVQTQYNHFLKGTPINRPVKRGDFIIWKEIDSQKGHIARITKVYSKYKVQTIEFNTGTNMRDGEGVFLKERNLRYIKSRLRIRGYCAFRNF